MNPAFASQNNPPQQVPLPASQFLHERLQERRARSTRSHRSRQSDFGPRLGHDDDIFLEQAEDERRATARTYDSSPLMATSQARSEAGRSACHPRRVFSLKDSGEQLDRLGKQNFALKLELDHRREHSAKLQERLDRMHAQVERAERLEQEHAELLRMNEQMVLELEKRDKAVLEAADIICDLEEEVRELKDGRVHTRPSTGNADSAYVGTETQEQAPPSSPPQLNLLPKTYNARLPPPSTSLASAELNNGVNGRTPARLRREPSFLGQKKPSTHALRSVYLESAHNLHSVKSFTSLLSKRGGKADGDGAPDDVLDSPRLSVLSESSFPSFYSPKKQTSPDRYAWKAAGKDDGPEPLRVHLRQDSMNRVSRWMTNGEAGHETPSTSNQLSQPMSERVERCAQQPALRKSSDEAQLQSLDHALSITPNTAAQPPHPVPAPTSRLPYLTKVEKQRGKQPKQSQNTGEPVFGQQLLPPTPESASTHMLRSSRSSMADERSLLDVTPAAVKGYDALQPGAPTVPKQLRSAIELNTSQLNDIQDRSTRHAHPQADYTSDDEDIDSRSETVTDLDLDYDGFPDGNSILMGTPSRFWKSTAPSAADTLFNGTDDLSPPHTARLAPPKRRQSGSSEAPLHPRKPSLSRADTSPTFLSTSGRIVSSGSSRSTTVVVSSRSTTHSASSSSGDRTITERKPSLSPTDQRRLSSFRPSTSASMSTPARTLSQRTQKLFRRLSNSPSEHAASLAPKAYDVDGRRPSTSASDARQMSGRRRPSLQARTWTEPAAAATIAVAAEEGQWDREAFARANGIGTVSYTHLTLPTKRIV